jgi:dTDP-4-amino-4,6-dideoxygalactose transaminase
MKIPFNKPYLTGKEAHYIYQAVYSGQLSGNGTYTKKCQSFFEEHYGFKKTLLTTSCTDALEMCAMLVNIEPGDEVIVPSYTFVSTALAFVRQGAKIIFADSRQDGPNIDIDKIESHITEKTKAIVVVHYAGVSVDMDKVMALSEKYNIKIVEDAAQAVESYYKGKPLGGIGHLGTFSFHETKNVISGEGGLLIINDEELIDRAEVIWEKGTNRASFFRGEVNKYGWVDIGSSFLPSETVAGFLYAQLENIKEIQNKRVWNWNKYNDGLQLIKDKVGLPFIPEYATNNGHMYYLITDSIDERSRLIDFLKERDIHSVFHYLSLHKSPYHLKNNEEVELPMSDYYTDRLLRLPMFYSLEVKEIEKVINSVLDFYNA